MPSRQRADPNNGRRVPGAWALIAAALLICAAAVGQTTQPADKLAGFNFRNAPPEVVLKALEQLYGVQFVTEAPLKQRLSVSSAGKVGAEAMVTLLDASLRRQGVAARREGNLIRIVPVSLAAAGGDDPPETCRPQRRGADRHDHLPDPRPAH